MSVDIHQSDYGTVIRITLVENGLPVDLTDLTTRQILLKNPTGTVFTKTASLASGVTDGMIKYTAESGLFEVPGTWQVQGRVAGTSTNFYSDIGTFDVKRNVSPL